MPKRDLSTEFSLPSKLNGLATWLEKTFELKQILLLNKDEDFFKFVNNVRFKQNRTTERVSYFSIGQRILRHAAPANGR